MRTCFTFLLPLLMICTISDRASAQDLDLNVAQRYLQKVKSHRGDIVRGYHLPASYASGYYSRRIEPYLSKQYPETARPEFLYRGMFLTPAELEDILVNGMKLSKVTWSVGGGGISFSSNMTEASTYIFHAAKETTTGIGVIFKVKMSSAMKPLNDKNLNPTHTIFKKHADVSSSELVGIYIWGEYGPENLTEVLQKASANKIVPHERWTGVFSEDFSR